MGAGAGAAARAALLGQTLPLTARLGASTAPSCYFWWLVAPTDQQSQSNGNWKGPREGTGLGILSSVAMSALHWEAPRWTQPKGRTASLHLLPVV